MRSALLKPNSKPTKRVFVLDMALNGGGYRVLDSQVGSSSSTGSTAGSTAGSAATSTGSTAGSPSTSAGSTAGSAGASTGAAAGSATGSVITSSGSTAGSVAGSTAGSVAGSTAGSVADSTAGSLASVDDVAFNATVNDAGADSKPKPKIKTAVNLVGSGAKIELCPSGDCVNGQVIMLSMSRMEEFDSSKKPFVQAATNFNALPAKWSAFEPYTVGGVDAVTTSFVAAFKVGKASTDTSFNLTAMIFQANGTAMNGKQTVDIPAGALKFSVMVKDWPFENAANQLRFGVELKALGKNKVARDPPTKSAKAGKAHMDRVDMGEGMFMDAPTLAVIDDVTTPIVSSVEVNNKKTELVWVFPSFSKSVYYDPVMGSTDPSASTTTTTTTNTTTTGPTATSTGSTAGSTGASAGSTVGSVAGSTAGSLGFIDEVTFNATTDDVGVDSKPKIKTAVNLVGSGAKIELCPSGDCVNGQVIMLSMSRMEEINDDTKNPVVQAAKNFNSLSAKWSAFEPYTVGGVDAMATSFLASFPVGKATTDTSFNLTAMIFQANGTVMNGNQTVDVPAGALKFSVAVQDWPFVNITNQLRFGVELKALGKGNAEQGTPTKSAKAGKKDIDRVDMGEGMFMDAPTLAVIDDVTTPINSSVEVNNKKTELVWVFPGFSKSLYYDPVMGSTDPSASVTTTNTATNTTDPNGTTQPPTGTNATVTPTTDGNATANATVSPTPTVATPTPTTTLATNTTTKASSATGMHVLGATVLGALVAAAIGGTLLG